MLPSARSGRPGHLRLASAGVVLVGEDGVVQQRCRPTIVTRVESFPGNLDNAVHSAHRGDIARSGLLRRVLPQPAGVAVEPAHVALVYGLDVVVDRTVIPVGMPCPLQRGRHGEVLGDLDPGVALVELAQGLVVQVGVQIPLQRKVFHDPVAPPGGPMVRGEHHVGAVGEGVDGLGEVARPGARVAHQGAAQGQ